MAEAPMGINFSVFNGHVNDADKKARHVMGELMPGWLKEVENIEAEQNGIMGIFQVRQTPALAAYAALVTAFVNEDRLTLSPDTLEIE